MITGLILRHFINRIIVEQQHHTLPNRAEAEQWLRTALDLYQHSQPLQQFTGRLTEHDYDWEDETTYVVAETTPISDPLDQITWSDQTEPWPIRGCGGHSEPWDAA